MADGAGRRSLGRTEGGRERRPSAGLRRKAARVDQLLAAFYGPIRRRRTLDPVSTLVLTILSQNTSDVNSKRAFERLRTRFATWEAVRDAPAGAVVAAIRSSGLGEVKARRIQAVLRRITQEQGRLSLDALRRRGPAHAKAWLRDLDGVGPKTAAIVMLFGFGLPAFPVDTHVFRVGRRLGLIPAHMSVGDAHPWMEALVRPDRYGSLHLLLVRHGREVCRAVRPRCWVCPVRRMCDFYRRARRAGTAPL